MFYSHSVQFPLLFLQLMYKSCMIPGIFAWTEPSTWYQQTCLWALPLMRSSLLHPMGDGLCKVVSRWCSAFLSIILTFKIPYSNSQGTVYQAKHAGTTAWAFDSIMFPPLFPSVQPPLDLSTVTSQARVWDALSTKFKAEFSIKLPSFQVFPSLT